MLHELYMEYLRVVESGDHSSPEYFTARCNYEDALRMKLGFGLNWEQAAIFASSMEYPTAAAIDRFFG